MSNEYIGFIGGGNMTRAIATGLIESHYPPDDLLIAEPAIEQRAVLDRDLPGVVIEESNVDVAARAGALVLAVKPQVMHEVVQDIAPGIAAGRPLVVSIAAGITEPTLRHWLGDYIQIRSVVDEDAFLDRQFAAFDDGLGARWCLAIMAARLQGYVERGALGQLAGLLQRRPSDGILSGDGGGMPRPRNPSVPMAKIA